jgi:Domain of unknown function (DUF5625)
MGPTTYALCQKAFIGPAMWIMGLCSFPPLISDLSFSLDAAGTPVASAFSVPVDRSYEFVLDFEFASTEARLQDRIVGTNYEAACSTEPTSLLGKSEYGRPIPIRVVIRKSSDKAILVESEFLTLCVKGQISNRKSRSIGWVALPRGEYIAEVTNLAVQEGLAEMKTSISLVPGGGK